MPMTTECLSLLRKFVDEYQNKGQTEDKDYTAIYTLLTDFLHKVTKSRKEYSDDRVNGCLASSALILQNNNPQFVECCKAYLIAFQSATKALDSFVDTEFNIKHAFEDYFQTEEISDSSAKINSSSGPFFIELQQAIIRRTQRMAAQEINSDHSQINSVHPTK